MAKKKDEVNARTIIDIERRFAQHVYPVIGQLPINSIQPQSVIAILQRVERVSTHNIARSIKQHIAAIFRFAVAYGLSEINPASTFHARDVIAIPPDNRHHAAFEYSELPAFLAALHRNDACLHVLTRLLLRMMLLTFVRTSELIYCQWSEINIKQRLWIIPGERMKTKRPHLVPLSRQAIRVFKELKRYETGNGYVFHSVIQTGSSMHFNTMKGALWRMGYRNKMTVHGFRSLAMTTIKEQLNYRHEVVDRQLAHVERCRTRRAYDRADFIQDRRRMMQDWADLLDRQELLGVRKLPFANNIRPVGRRSKRAGPQQSSKR